ncbi:MAG: ABC transporter permease [Thermoleophilia bacterium]|nr:ABC transporter permease [Thermoleophilia bacterium]
MLSVIWIRGLLARRPGRLLATAAGVAVAVALLASIGAFLSGTTASMTARAVSRVPLDWQVAARAGSNPGRLLRDVRAFPGVTTALPVGYAHAAGYSATSRGATTSAGPGIVLGIPPNYRATYPGEVKQLIGARAGVLIAQQLAANLGVGLGDSIAVQLPGRSAERFRIDGVIDLPAADSLFQTVGAPPGAPQPPPPDNVLVLPLARWHTAFDAVARSHPALVRTQIHAGLERAGLPADPVGASIRVGGLARNLETQLQGAAIVGNNLEAALAQARSDSLYARIVFLFLGLPGAVLAALVTASIAAAGGDRRRREQALLRARGATVGDLLRLALAEAFLVALIGGLAGLGSALLIGRAAFRSGGFGGDLRAAILWNLGALAAGLVIASSAIALPAWRDSRLLTVSGAGTIVGRPRAPLWARLWLDVVALVGSALIFWRTGSNGYRLVLAVEGAPQVSVDYYSFLAPLLLWVGIGLLSWRLADLLLRRGGSLVSRLVGPLAGSLSQTVAATMVRQRRQLARALTLVTLTVAFAGSTAAFNATYKQQAEADARLSNGADVVVTESQGTRVGPDAGKRLASVPGVRVVEPVQHRFAYIGADLQDLYGVGATTIVRNGRLQDGFFSGGTAKELFATLAARPDSILVSQEAVTDYQLKPGDRVNLRLFDGRTRKLIPVPFTYAGIALEFPTAPRDSFFIANAKYVARTTGSNAVGTFLIQTGGVSPDRVARRVAAEVGTSARVTDITMQRRDISGSITSVEVAGLTRVELGFALLFGAAATGLLLWLGLAERRRTFAIAQALGATPRQLGSFVWSETLFVTVGGLVLGAVGAATLAVMLVKILTGVFDPPPTSLAIPWLYLTGVAVVTISAVAVAGAAAIRSVRRPALSILRDL